MPQYKRCTNDSTTLTKAGVRSVHPHDAWIMSLSNWYFCLSYRNFSQWLFSPIDAIHTLTRTINCGKLNCKTFLFVFFLLIQVMRYIIHVFCFNSKFMYVNKMQKKKKKKKNRLFFTDFRNKKWDIYRVILWYILFRFWEGRKVTRSAKFFTRIHPRHSLVKCSEGFIIRPKLAELGPKR